MKKMYPNPMRHAAAVLTAALALGGLFASTARADYYQWPASIPVETEVTNAPRGVYASPILNAPVVTPTNVTVSWYGMQGWSTVEATTNMVNYFPVAGVAASEHSFSATLTNAFGPSAMFQVAQTNYYSGSGDCSGCHGDKYNEYYNTAHSVAINAILNPDGSFKPFRNATCLPCHTVGMNQPTGYAYTNSAQAVNSHLSNVGCESCHGPAGWHKGSDHSLIRPVVSIDPKICGSCHQDSHHPTYEEFAESLHAAPAHSTGLNCSPCHSAANRMSMLNEWQDRMAGSPHQLELADASAQLAWTAACATCHDPHSAEMAGQLRNPMFSTNYFTMPSVADGNNNTTFDTFYDPNVQICGQCHNTRGARWDGLGYAVMTTNVVSGPVTNVAYVDVYTTTYTTNSRGAILTNSYVSGRIQTNLVTLITNAVRYTGLTTNVNQYGRPPHHSPQYNVLIGNVQPGYLPVITYPHTRIANQCVACHVPNYAVSSTTNVTGHTFEMDVKGCALAGCHTSYSEAALELKIEDLQIQESNKIAGVVSLLNQWATTKAPALLGATDYNKSLQNSWEFTIPGQLATITNAGPSSTKQPILPQAIRKARFNLYMVEHDGSLGVHNPTYTKFLLADAETNVLSQLSDIPAAFSANTVLVNTGATVTFANLNPSATGGVWNFGDGAIGGGLNATHVYTVPGTYSVTFTETGGSTLTRTAYIKVRENPTLNFTANVVTGPAPLTVTFTNTSTSTADVDWWRWQFNTASSATRLDTPDTVVSYTYTNAGIYSVSLRANLSGGGNVSTTKTSYITVQ